MTSNRLKFLSPDLAADSWQPRIMIVGFVAMMGLTPQAGQAQSQQAATAAQSQAEAVQQIEFFETRIRPVLVEHCYQCHNSTDTAEGGLAIDSRPATLAGGSTGKMIVPGDPESSRLLPILRHEIAGLEMPDGGPKLGDAVIADFETWIRMGAPDPRDKPPSAAEFAATTAWAATLERRKRWWSLQPIKNPEIPTTTVDDAHPIDQFIGERLRAANLQPAAPAATAVLIRRLHFALIGLPPTPEDLAKWSERISRATAGDRPTAVAALVDELLGSPHFGERWARHWMDWIRYAESHGSEGDPVNKHAWQYRDYLIRALNADVAYDQLVREHIAGDLLDTPRQNNELGINESAIGPAHWRMVFHGFAPTDALDEKVRFTDDQINAFSKAFLGLTVSCARCHDHKFDAISQTDYYALFGILGSCRPGRTVIDLPERGRDTRHKLSQLKAKLRTAIAKDWKRHLDAQPLSLNTADALSLLEWANEDTKPEGRSKSLHAPLHHWDLTKGTNFRQWFAVGNGLPAVPYAAGDFDVAIDGEQALNNIFLSGIHSHSLSQKSAARLTSPDITLTEDADVWLLVCGDRGATVRYVVQNYPRNGTVYPVKKLTPDWEWQKFDVSYWKGDTIHLELATAEDAPLLTSAAPRSWFAIREVIIQQQGQPAPPRPPESRRATTAVTSPSSPASPDKLQTRFNDVITSAIDAFGKSNATDQQAAALNRCLELQVLPNNLSALTNSKSLIAEYRRLEAALPVPIRVPGVEETVGRDQPFFLRGDHRSPAESVPRRFLEAIDPTPYKTEMSGRRELAEDVLRMDNPLTRRVIVNRLWHHLFGRGLVGTPDNLGQLGERVTHPELLDWLATRFAADGWSLKNMIRLMVTSKTWQQSSTASAAAVQADPQNLLLSHGNLRRLEAEAIRDSLLFVSGQLQLNLYGPPVTGTSPRRSIYVKVIRNSLDPFLRTFDFPEPFSSVGRRDVTNVPAQSLTMLNDPLVIQAADSLAKTVLKNSNDASRKPDLSWLLTTVLGREATEDEISRSLSFVSDTTMQIEKLHMRWQDLEAQITALQERLDTLMKAARSRIAHSANSDAEEATLELPVPVFDLDFAEYDSQRLAEGTLRNGGRVVDGALLTSEGGFMVSQRISTTIREKTLQAWVQLDDLNQRGGGVISLQSINGRVFDAVVFAEQQSRHWLAGSDHFRRTRPLQAKAESEADRQPVHIAIVYHGDGMIAAFRNGHPHGKPYQSDGPVQFAANECEVVLGLRHSPAGGNKHLAGRIFRAQLFNRALSADEVLAFATQSPRFMSRAQVMAALTSQERVTVVKSEQAIQRLTQERETLNVNVTVNPQELAWSDLARAILTVKEFIYVQ